MRVSGVAAVAFAVFASVQAARADTCSDRGGVCVAACTPRQVESGAQFGGTVAGCRKSCQSRLRSCLKTGVWIHMGSARRGEQERVERE